MVTIKRKKNTRLRAKTTHGYGSMKKNRGAGHRGGRGRAGSGKRGDVKKPSLMWEKGHKHKGKVGFTSHSRSETVVAINLALLEQRLESYISNKLVEKKGDVYFVDLSKLKYTKLLGTGKVNNKYEIITKLASQRAIAKIEEAGGKVILPSVEPITAPEKKENPKGTSKKVESSKEESKEAPSDE